MSKRTSKGPPASPQDPDPSSTSPGVVNKADLVKKIVARLTAELGLYAKAARAAHAEATHEQSKAENKYDTRGLEASYLARGQSRQAAEIAQAIEDLRKLPLEQFGVNDPIGLSAVVELDGKGERSFYFVAPRAGGTEIVHRKKEMLVITPQSPLGRELIARKQGDRVYLDLGGSQNEYRIVQVW